VERAEGWEVDSHPATLVTTLDRSMGVPWSRNFNANQTSQTNKLNSFLVSFACSNENESGVLVRHDWRDETNFVGAIRQANEAAVVSRSSSLVLVRLLV
jgi:hypothetical protein